MMTFTVDDATGQGTLESGDAAADPADGVDRPVMAARSGKATLACPDNLLLITLPTVRLEFERLATMADPAPGVDRLSGTGAGRAPSSR